MTPETPSEVSNEDAEFWHREIKAAQDRREEWYGEVEIALERYDDSNADNRVRFGGLNIHWANVETQRAALDSDFGKPQVSRINKAKSDALARHVSMVLEQTVYAAVTETNDNHEIATAVHQVPLTGLAQIWQELNPVTDEAGKVIWIEAPIVSLSHCDYLEGPAARDGDVPWKARRHLYTLDDLRAMDAKNGTSHADSVPRNYSLPMKDKNDRDKDEKGKEQFKRAVVWEIWARNPIKRRIYIAEDYETPLKVDEDPFRLKGFFPCPRPIVVNTSCDVQIPHTDYSRYADQIEEVNRLSQRIFVLTEVLRYNGVCDKRFSTELKHLLTADDNTIVPVEDWSEFQTKGGLPALVQYTDVSQVAQVLAELHRQRAELIQLIYELTGISDLARGQTDPRETLGAQKLKRTFGSSRFKMRYDESRRLARDAYAIKGELISEHFQRDQMQTMAGMPLPILAEKQQSQLMLRQMMQAMQAAMAQGGQPPFTQHQVTMVKEVANAPFTWEDISAVLRADARRCYMVDIDTDQTKFQDEEQDKAQRIEFMAQVNGLLQQFGPMIAGNPANGEIFKQLIMFALSAFRAGRAMEEGIEQAIDNAVRRAQEQAQQPQQPPPSQVDQAKVQLIQAQIQKLFVEMQMMQATGAASMQDAQAKADSIQQKLAADNAKTQAHIAAANTKVEGQMAANEAKRQGHMIDMQNKAEQLEFERQQRATAGEMILRDGATAKPRAAQGSIGVME